PRDEGTCTVSLTAKDKDGQQGTSSKIITVTQVAPTVTITGGPAGSISEGTPVTLNSTVSDGVDADTPITYAWTVTSSNGQTASGSSSSLSFTPTDDGIYTVTLSVKDKDGQPGTSTTSITVDQVAPTRAITCAPATQPDEGTP